LHGSLRFFPSGEWAQQFRARFVLTVVAIGAFDNSSAFDSRLRGIRAIAVRHLFDHLLQIWLAISFSPATPHALTQIKERFDSSVMLRSLVK
jgi:hypothetical protein